MARYEVNFTLNGERYHTSGTSSYPQPDLIQSGEIDHRMALENAMMFVSGYMDAMRLQGHVNPNTVDWLIFRD